MIDELATAYELLLNTERQAGGLIEGVNSVQIGDDLPLADYNLPGIALDVSTLPREPFDEGGAPGSRLSWVIPIKVILYDTDTVRGAALRRVWRLLTPSTPTTPGGLVWLVNKYNRIKLDSGVLFHAEAGRFVIGSITKNNQQLTGAVATITFTTWGPKPS